MNTTNIWNMVENHLLTLDKLRYKKHTLRLNLLFVQIKNLFASLRASLIYLIAIKCDFSALWKCVYSIWIFAHITKNRTIFAKMPSYTVFVPGNMWFLTLKLKEFHEFQQQIARKRFNGIDNGTDDTFISLRNNTKRNEMKWNCRTKIVCDTINGIVWNRSILNTKKANTANLNCELAICRIM